MKSLVWFVRNLSHWWMASRQPRGVLPVGFCRWDCVSGSAFLKKSVPGWGTLQSNGISLGEGDCDFVAGLSNDAVEGLAGDAHACGGIDPVKVLGVREPQGLDLLREQHGFLQIAQGDACGLEIIAGRLVGDGSGAGWSGHGTMRM